MTMKAPLIRLHFIAQDGTIKCFDTRCDKAIYTFYSNSESVRDVKFSPHCNNVFSAVSENGTVQLWDLRRDEKCLLQFTAHSGPIYTCGWYSTNNWLATGSRDKQMKVLSENESLRPAGYSIASYTADTVAKCSSTLQKDGPVLDGSPF
uniref:GATOR2 complex protein WDR24 n=1 Tax=Glossina palpalis gambiensis TaxID=67801 RepID=A0A1B0ASB0_9MUSC